MRDRPASSGERQDGRDEGEVGADTVDELAGGATDIRRRRERERGEAVNSLHERDARAVRQWNDERVEELHFAVPVDVVCCTCTNTTHVTNNRG